MFSRVIEKLLEFIESPIREELELRKINVLLVCVGLAGSCTILWIRALGSLSPTAEPPETRLLLLALAFIVWSFITPYAKNVTLYMQLSVGILGGLLIAAHESAIVSSRETLKDIGVALIIAAIVSLVYDVAYHSRQFGQHVSKIEKIVESIGNLLLIEEFREELHKSYETASQEIINVGDVWLMERSWVTTGTWTGCSIFESLISKKCKAQKITFGGRVPQILYSEGHKRPRATSFSPDEFRRFVGVVWRWVLCTKILEERAIKKRTPVAPKMAVLVAGAPFSACMVDNKVFLFFHDQRSPHESQGLRLKDQGGRVNSSRARSYKAVLYAALDEGTPAEEYIASTLLASAMACGISQSREIHECLPTILEQLGFDAWFAHELSVDGLYHNTVESNDFKLQVRGLFEQFIRLFLSVDEPAYYRSELIHLRRKLI